MARILGVLCFSVLALGAVRGEAACTDAAALDATASVLDQACGCADATSHASYVRCARAVVRLRVGAGELPRSCRREVLRCARRSTCGRSGAVACLRTNRRLRTRCKIVRDAARCASTSARPIALATTGSCCAACPSTACRWVATCGDPSCSQHRDVPGVAACTDQALGEPCRVRGERCDPGNDCNSHLLCELASPPPGTCPISRASAKTAIRYLDPEDVSQLHHAVLDLRLVRWRYRGETVSADPHLGFIIDDVGRSPAVAPDGDHVDLYGYASMAVAAIQAQAREIEALRAEVARLRARMEASGER